MRPWMKVRSAGGSVLSLACWAGAARAAPGACDPPCAKSLSCNLDGTCVTDCAPPCGDEETCVHFQCVPAPPPVPGIWRPHLALGGGLLFQYSPGTSQAPAVLQFGESFALHLELGDIHRLFFGPRAALLGAFENNMGDQLSSGSPAGITGEAGFDLGYRGRFGQDTTRVGPIAWVEGQYWALLGPYVGTKAGLIVETRRRFMVSFVAGGGATVRAPAQGAFSFGVDFVFVAF
jgi:hypothetical protein